MAGALGTSRMRAARESKLGRYLLYAAGEVFLIFVGITLAVAFDDSSDRRRQVELSHGILLDIRENLEGNIVELETSLAVDEINLAAIALIVAHLSTSATWADSLDSHLAQARHWSSPILSSSGYESLKQNGLHLLSDPALRARIVGLFENSYGRLVGDIDRNMWTYMGSVVYPYQSRELVRSDSGEEVLRPRMAPRDYSDIRARGELRTMLLEHQFTLSVAGRYRRQALSETRDLIEAIDSYLPERVDR